MAEVRRDGCAWFECWCCQSLVHAQSTKETTSAWIVQREKLGRMDGGWMGDEMDGKWEECRMDAMRNFKEGHTQAPLLTL